MTFPPSVIRRAPRAGALLALAVAAGAAFWATAMPGAAGAAGEAQRVGDVSIVAAANRGKVLTDGGSATLFSLHLSGDDECPGDSEHDQWRVQSFFVPATADPATLHYGVVGPEGKDQYSLFDERTNSYTDVLLQANVSPGEVAQMADLPAFGLGVFPPGSLPAGRYRLGIACTYFRDTATYWDTTITVTDSASDEPGGFVWRADAPAPAAGSAADGSDSKGPLVGGAIALVLLIAGVAVVLLRPRREAHPSERAA